MAVSFDSLGYARHLREHGVPQEQAEAHADAARMFIMRELVTNEDLRLALDNAVLQLTNRIDNLSLRLTVRTGVMIAAGVAILGTLLKLT